MVPTNIVLAGATGVAVGLPGLEEEVDNAGRTCTAVLSIFALDVWQPIKGNYDLLNAVTIEAISIVSFTCECLYVVHVCCVVRCALYSCSCKNNAQKSELFQETKKQSQISVQPKLASFGPILTIFLPFVKQIFNNILQNG